MTCATRRDALASLGGVAGALALGSLVPRHAFAAQPALVFPALPARTIEVAGDTRRYAVHRIYCLGGNYPAHVEEAIQRGSAIARDKPPQIFDKPADAIVPGGGAVPYPQASKHVDYECELVVAIGRAGRDIAKSRALGHVYGYAVGIDLSRRDVIDRSPNSGPQAVDITKGFDNSCPIAAIHPVTKVGHVTDAKLWLTLDGVQKQQGNVKDMIFDVASSIEYLSSLFVLQPGDLIMTGTPPSPGPIARGQKVVGGIDGLGTIEFTLT